MEWNDKLQTIIDYVENHLQRKEEPIDYNEIAKIADCSFSFFQKVFSYINGLSFADYVRQRKMTLAGYDLKSTNMKIVDISYKYGYDSPTSFTKAFQQFHGLSPKDARQKETTLTITPKMQVTYKQSYTWNIKKMSHIRLIGKAKRISCNNNEHYKTIPEFFNEFLRSSNYPQLISLDCGNPKGIFGLVDYYDKETNEINYCIMIQSDKELPVGYYEINLPETTWAIFDCRGSVPQSIQKGWTYLNEEWLLKYPFKHAACPELEWYSDQDQSSSQYLSQIWIPIMEEE